MELHGKYIVFTPEEQTFSLKEVLSLDEAEETAVTLTSQAHGLQLRAESLVGDASREAQVRRQALLHEASELNTFARAIGHLISPTPVEQFINDIRTS